MVKDKYLSAKLKSFYIFGLLLKYTSSAHLCIHYLSLFYDFDSYCKALRPEIM